MPMVRIEILKGRSVEEKQALLTSVYSALTEALKKPDLYRHLTLQEYEMNNFFIPLDKTQKYTSIEIQLFEGKSLETKKRIYQTIVRNLNELEIDGNDIFIYLHELPLACIAMRGGIPASEIYPNHKPEV